MIHGSNKSEHKRGKTPALRAPIELHRSLAVFCIFGLLLRAIHNFILFSLTLTHKSTLRFPRVESSDRRQATGDRHTQQQGTRGAQVKSRHRSCPHPLLLSASSLSLSLSLSLFSRIIKALPPSSSKGRNARACLFSTPFLNHIVSSSCPFPVLIRFAIVSPSLLRNSQVLVAGQTLRLTYVCIYLAHRCSPPCTSAQTWFSKGLPLQALWKCAAASKESGSFRRFSSSGLKRRINLVDNERRRMGFRSASQKTARRANFKKKKRKTTNLPLSLSRQMKKKGGGEGVLGGA